MKIVLFRDGRRGVAAKLPGEDPEVELTDLLGGETEMVPVTSKLCVVMLEHGKELGLKPFYTAHRKNGTFLTQVYGDCALIALEIDGSYRDVSLDEVAVAEEYVRCEKD